MRKLQLFLIGMLERFKIIPPISSVNQPCYDKYGRFIGWLSRSVAAAIFIYCKDKNGEWCVLGSERGEEAADYQGFWNCPCGYLDRDETTKEAALRELYEETGVFVDENDVQFVGYEDSPNANRQNVTFRFAAFLDDAATTNFSFSKKNNEGKEVGEIKWIRINDIDNYMWSFNHDKIIKEIYAKKFGN